MKPVIGKIVKTYNGLLYSHHKNAFLDFDYEYHTFDLKVLLHDLDYRSPSSNNNELLKTIEIDNSLVLGLDFPSIMDEALNRGFVGPRFEIAGCYLA
jgi:hypothetical protein